MEFSSQAVASLGSKLSQTALRFPHREAIVFEKQRFTWRELDQQVDAVARSLLDLGVEPGDRVGVMGTTRPETVISYLATVRVGAILVGFNIHYTAREVEELARLSTPKVIIFLGQMAASQPFQAMLAQLPFVQHWISMGRHAPAGFRSWEELVAGGQSPQGELERRASQVAGEDGALMVFTGGTTGLPKGALLTHGNILANIAAQNRHLGWTHEDRLVLHLPMNHVSGATLLTAGAVLSGATLVMLERFHPIHTLQAVQQEGVTILGQVPTMFIMQFLHPEFDRFDLSSLRMVLVAGAPTPDWAMKRIAGLAPLAVHGYGLTEATGMVAYTRPGEGLERLLGGVGQVAPEFELRIVDEKRTPLPSGQAGEIAVRGPCVMAGFYRDPIETAIARDEAGWLYTGDLGRLDAEGYLTVLGWRKEMYICGGYNVYPREVERCLNRHPQIAASACVGCPDQVMGQVGQVFVVPADGALLSVKEIKAYCWEGLARYKNPRMVHICDRLPQLGSGSVDKAALRSRC